MLRLTPFLLVALLFSPQAAHAHRRGKPQPPIDLTLTASDSGDRKVLLLSARPNVEGKGLKLEIKLPPGVSLIQGEALWEGPVQEKSLEILVEGERDRIGLIRGVATIDRPEGEIVQIAKMAPSNSSAGGSLKPKAPTGGVVESQGAP